MNPVSPFRFGKVVTGEYFIDREEEIIRIRNNITSKINTVLISPRRWGKTSLIRQIAQKTWSNKNKFVFIDFYNIRTEEEFFNTYAQEILKASLTKVNEFLRAGRDFFKTIIPYISYSVDPQHDLSLKVNWNEVKKAKSEIIDLPEIIAKKKKIQLNICIDEFQNIAKLDNYIQVEEDLRAHWQHHEQVAYCLYGSKRHMMSDIFNQESRPFYRFGDLIMLNKIPKDHWILFITKSFANTGKQINSEYAEKIVELADNHPDYIQQLCHHLWNLTDSKVDKDIIMNAVDLVLSSNAILYQETCENLSYTQINLLKAVVKGETQFTSNAVMDQYGMGTPRNVWKNKKVLENKEIIDFHTENAYFMDPFFKYWFTEKFLR
jgi:AAA+ ATPase superfamily predicted ATPase